MEQRVALISLAEFLDWEATQEHRHELLHGKIFAFSGASKDHNHIAGNVHFALRQAVRPPCTAYGSDIILETITRKADNGLRADAVVSCSEADSAGAGRYLFHPKIVVEVRSPTNHGGVWDAKLLEYWSTPDIEQVVIIESETRAASSFLRDESGAWHPPVTSIGSGSLRFPALDLEMTLDEIYRLSTLASD